MISVDSIKQYKPTKQAYQHVIHTLNMDREEILFLSSNTWDIAGAKNFGFKTAWVNRKNRVMDYLDRQPDFVINDLNELVNIMNR
jgi:2-haloacid dehalogenase